MQLRLRLLRLDSIGQQRRSSMGSGEQKPRYYAHLLTFTPVDSPADGTPTGDMHLAGVNPQIQLLVSGDQDIDIPVGGEVLMTLQKS